MTNDRFSKPLPDHVFLSISGDAKTSATVSWRTCPEQDGGYIEYRCANGGDVKRASAVSKILESDIDTSRFYSAVADGLEPDTGYIYTVGNSNFRSPEFSFKTAPDNLTKFKFIIISDHQNSIPYNAPEYAPVRELLKDMLKKHPDCRFILTAGDNCDNGQNEVQWNGMFHGLEGIIESIPYMMSTGNHDNRGYLSYETGTGKFYLDHADFFDGQFESAFPQNGPEGYTTENYSFDFGNVHFLIMGINAPEVVSDWAFNDLQSSDKTWKLGVYHFPIYPVMPEGQNDDAYPWLRKPIEEGRLDVLFAGHEHSFARTFPAKNDELFDRPSQGTVHYIAGNSGRNIYCSNARKVWHSAFFPQEEPLSIATLVEVDGEKLTVTALLEDGRIADVLVIDKAEDTIFPLALAPVYSNTKLCYKGDMLDFGARGIYCRKIDGEWFIPVGVLMQNIGAAVVKEAGKLTVSAYGETVVFIDGSDTAESSEGTIALASPAIRGDREQIYIRADDCAKIFGMKWQYARRNNYINFDHASENVVVSPQP